MTDVKAIQETIITLGSHAEDIGIHVLATLATVLWVVKLCRKEYCEFIVDWHVTTVRRMRKGRKHHAK